jgi:hypothetical protein
MKKILSIFLTVIFFMGITSLFAQNVNVTFSVDMSVQIGKGFFNPDTEVVTCPGSFNNWLNEPPANTTKEMSDENKDKIYTITMALAPNTTYEYKFAIGLTWHDKDEPGSNRTVKIGAADTVLPVLFFRNEHPSGNPAPVVFNVDMSLIAKSNFNPATQKVMVAGTFTKWGTNAIEMSDPNNDSIYTVQVDTIKSGTNIEFKFLYSSGLPKDGSWEDLPEGGNRKYFVLDGTNTINAFWANKDPNVTLGNGNIIFLVDMSVMNEVGIYDPVVDSLQLRANFNAWSAGTNAVMGQDPINPLQWSRSSDFVNTALNESEDYKYFVDINDTSKHHWQDGYERPTPNGGGNRSVAFLGQVNQEVGMQYYDGIQPDWVIAAGKNLQATFRVDMTPAMDPLKQVPTFNPATDTLWWISEQPTFVATQGWYDKDQMKVLMLTDPDGDKIYEGTLNVKAPSFNSFMYRYGFVHKDETTGSMDWTIELGGFKNFAYRVRFIHQTGERTFVNPYTMNKDTWTNIEVKPASEQETDPYNNAVGVYDKDIVANKYSLEQNYPNPFNPATKISFSIPESGIVTLKIYNLLGEEVSTLVNGDLKAGTYEANFNASNLTSGIYFYTIKAGNFSETKKMLLLK